MANISVTHQFTNLTPADATEVNTNFADIIAGTSDGTKDFSVNNLTLTGSATLNGDVTLGNATGDDLTFNGRIASDLDPKTTATYSIGSTTLTYKDIFLDNGATDGGAIYFNASATAFIKSDASAGDLDISGFTDIDFNTVNLKGSGNLTFTGTLSNDGAAVFNESGANVDFRIEGDTEANLFFVDASSDRIGVGTNDPNGLSRVIHINNSGAANAGLHITNSTTGSTSSDGSLIYADSSGNLWFNQQESAGTITFYHSGTTVGYFDTDSNSNRFIMSVDLALNGVATGLAPLGVQGNGTTDSTQAFIANDSGGSRNFTLYDDGQVGVRTGGWGTGGTAIGYDTGDNKLTTSPSSKRYKKNFLPLNKEIDASKVIDLIPTIFDYITDGKHSFGYLAEDVYEILPCLVHTRLPKDEDDESIIHPDGVVIESVNYSLLSVLIVEYMKTQVSDFNARIAAIEAA